LLHLNSSLASTDGRQPVGAAGVTFEPGVFGNGAFLGGTGTLSYDSSPVLSASEGTIEFWIKPRWAGSDNQTHNMLSVPGKLLIAKDGNNNLRFILGTDDSEAYQAWNLSGWKANSWHHMAVVWQVPGVMKTYVDGVQRIINAAADRDLMVFAGQLLYVGGFPATEAVFDEVRISNIARSDSDIAKSYVAGLKLTSIVMQMTFPEIFPTWKAQWTLTGDAGLQIPPRAAALTSSDPAVARVEADGTITGVAAGVATITAIVNGLSATGKLTVKAPVLPPEIIVPDAALSQPASGSLYEIPVVILRYLPTTDGTGLDVSFSPDFYSLGPITLTQMKSNIDGFDRNIKFALEEATRFRGYKNPQANPSLGYKVVVYITVYEPVPPGKAPNAAANVQDGSTVASPLPIYSPDLFSIFGRFGIDQYVNQLGVREIWLWFGYVDPSYPSYDPTIHTPDKLRSLWESQMSSPSTGNISNSNRDNTDLPLYDHTYLVYSQNLRRTQAEAHHNRGHQFEDMFSYANARDSDTNLFWRRFVGLDDNGNFVQGRCGDTHFPPNATYGYDYLNPKPVLSDCEDWTPAGTGQQKLTNADTWGTIPYAWPDPTLPQRTESQWYIYWMQNMPGLGNQIRSGNLALTNWWDLVAEWDAATDVRMGLTSTPSSYLVSNTSFSLPAKAATGTVNVTASVGPWVALSNNDWIRITSGRSGSAPGSVKFALSDNTGPFPRQGSMVAAEHRIAVNQAGNGINAVVDSASYRATIAPNSFVTIYGSSFTSWTGDWSGSAPNGVLPTTLGGVQVRIDGKYCFVSYVSSGQLNVLTPFDTASGSVPVEVVTAQGTATATAVMEPVAPALFGYTMANKFHAVAQIANTTIVVAPVGTFGSAPSRPARAGEYVVLYALGMGSTSPAAPSGVVLPTVYPVSDLSSVKVKFGSLDASVSWAGMVMAGLFQVNVLVPPGLSGDQLVVMTVDGQSTQANAFLTFQ
jgi:uncharacterized protein (TIGR03437 family)